MNMQQAGTNTVRTLAHATTGQVAEAEEIIVTITVRVEVEGIMQEEGTGTITEILKKDINKIRGNSFNPGYLLKTSGFFILHS